MMFTVYVRVLLPLVTFTTTGVTAPVSPITPKMLPLNVTAAEGSVGVAVSVTLA